jgi:hypothetical protein
MFKMTFCFDFQIRLMGQHTILQMMMTMKMTMMMTMIMMNLMMKDMQVYFLIDLN